MQPQHEVVRRDPGSLRETSVRLDHLPEGLAFPEDFPKPIRYDPAHQRLIYRGLMTSSSYRFLRGLCQDVAYLEALDYLFQQSAYPPPARGRWSTRVRVWLLIAVCLGAVTAIASLYLR